MMLDGQVALVAGATGVIGSAVVAALRRAGATVATHGRRTCEGVFSADLTEPDAAGKLVRAVTARHGAPSILVNLVHPRFTPAPLLDGDWAAHWLPNFTGGLMPALALTQAVVPTMQALRYGRIVHVSGGLSARAARGCAAYSAAKAALNMLARTTALECGSSCITVNIVAPGEVRAQDVPHDPAYDAVNVGQRATQAMPGIARPDDVAAAILSFVDPSARFVTGQTLFVNGGQVMP